MSPRSNVMVLCVLLGVFSNAHAYQTIDLCDFDGGPPSPHSIAGYSASYDSSAVPGLIAKLDSETDWGHRACWALVLGVVGDERAVDALIAAVEKPLNPQEPQDHEARRIAITGLGYLVNRTGSVRALTYLIDGLTRDAWRKRNVQGLPPFIRTYAEYDRLLSEYALMALAVSGDPRAGQALRSLQSAPTPEQALSGSQLDDLLASWLDVHRVVAERGLQGMYDYFDAQRRLNQERAAEEARARREALYRTPQTN